MLINEILTGWANSFLDEFNLLPENIKQMSENRLSICNSCPLRTEHRCDNKKEGRVIQTFMYKNQKREIGEIHSGCGCPLNQKSFSPNSQCPLNKF